MRQSERIWLQRGLISATHFPLNQVAISLPFLTATSVPKRITAALAMARLPVSALPVCWLSDFVGVFQAWAKIQINDS